MIKIVLLDLDGTLLNSEKKISPANYAALKTCAENGVHIVPATGRFYEGMPEAAKGLPFVRYVVTVNGAQVYDAAEQQVLHQAEIPVERALEVYDVLDTLPVIYDCFLNGWGYMDKTHYEKIDEYTLQPQVTEMVKRLRKPVENFRDFLLAQNKPLQKLQMFFYDMAARAEALKTLPKLFPDLVVSSSIPNNIEINAKNATKGEALKFLCRYLDVDIRDTMAFGDSSNDLSMIAAAGVGVAMENAEPELKAAADYVTDSNDNDGVKKALDLYCLKGV